MKIATTRLITLILFCFLISIPSSSTVFAQASYIEKTDNGEEVYNRKLVTIMQALDHGDKDTVANTIELVKQKPEIFAPPALYALSNALFRNGMKDEAAFWFYAGQVRARYDANRCADASARGFVSILNKMYGNPINQYSFQNPENLEETITKVLEWDKETPNNYDPRWINPHGTDFVLKKKGISNPKKGEIPMSLPENQWPEIKEKTHKQYIESFQNVLKKLKTINKN